MGIGAIPDAVLARLKGNTTSASTPRCSPTAWSTSFEAGAFTNRLKEVHPGRIVTSFVNGSRRLYDFVDDNPMVEFHPCDRTNDTSLIRKNDRVVAINSAIQVDLTGQVCATRSGTGSTPGSAGRWTSSAARRSPAAARRSSPCRDRQGGSGLPHRAGARPRRRRGDDARARPLGGDRARRGNLHGKTLREARRAAHRRSPTPTSGPSCSSGWPGSATTWSDHS